MPVKLFLVDTCVKVLNNISHRVPVQRESRPEQKLMWQYFYVSSRPRKWQLFLVETLRVERIALFHTRKIPWRTALCARHEDKKITIHENRLVAKPVWQLQKPKKGQCNRNYFGISNSIFIIFKINSQNLKHYLRRLVLNTRRH